MPLLGADPKHRYVRLPDVGLDDPAIASSDGLRNDEHRVVERGHRRARRVELLRLSAREGKRARERPARLDEVVIYTVKDEGEARSDEMLRAPPPTAGRIEPTPKRIHAGDDACKTAADRERGEECRCPRSNRAVCKDPRPEGRAIGKSIALDGRPRKVVRSPRGALFRFDLEDPWPPPAHHVDRSLEPRAFSDRLRRMRREQQLA